MPKELKNTKYILRRATNGKKRVKHASTALYVKEKMFLQKKADEFAQKHLGHKSMSVSAFIRVRLLLPY